MARWPKRSDLDRFRSHVDSSGGPDACHLWTAGSRNESGYGAFKQDGRGHLAHRWILGYLRGAPLTHNEVACHHCDNPRCVNPLHLYVGDHHQNMRDMAVRGRARNPLASEHAAKTHCPSGHPYDEQNTYYLRMGRGRLGRRCRACGRERSRRRRALKARP